MSATALLTCARREGRAGGRVSATALLTCARASCILVAALARAKLLLRVDLGLPRPAARLHFGPRYG